MKNVKSFTFHIKTVKICVRQRNFDPLGR